MQNFGGGDRPMQIPPGSSARQPPLPPVPRYSHMPNNPQAPPPPHMFGPNAGFPAINPPPHLQRQMDPAAAAAAAAAAVAAVNPGMMPPGAPQMGNPNFPRAPFMPGPGGPQQPPMSTGLGIRQREWELSQSMGVAERDKKRPRPINNTGVPPIHPGLFNAATAAAVNNSNNNSSNNNSNNDNDNRGGDSNDNNNSMNNPQQNMNFSFLQQQQQQQQQQHGMQVKNGPGNFPSIHPSHAQMPFANRPNLQPPHPGMQMPPSRGHGPPVNAFGAFPTNQGAGPMQKASVFNRAPAMVNPTMLQGGGSGTTTPSKNIMNDQQSSQSQQQPNQQQQSNQSPSRISQRQQQLPRLSKEMKSEPETFKEFLARQPDTISPQDAKELYDQYVKDFKKQVPVTFFDLHKTEEWFKERYDPDYVLARVARIRQECQDRAKDYFKLWKLGGSTVCAPDISSKSRGVETPVIEIEDPAYKNEKEDSKDGKDKDKNKSKKDSQPQEKEDEKEKNDKESTDIKIVETTGASNDSKATDTKNDEINTAKKEVKNENSEDEIMVQKDEESELKAEGDTEATKTEENPEEKFEDMKLNEDTKERTTEIANKVGKVEDIAESKDEKTEVKEDSKVEPEKNDSESVTKIVTKIQPVDEKAEVEADKAEAKTNENETDTSDDKKDEDANINEKKSAAETTELGDNQENKTEEKVEASIDLKDSEKEKANKVVDASEKKEEAKIETDEKQKEGEAKSEDKKKNATQSEKKDRSGPEPEIKKKRNRSRNRKGGKRMLQLVLPLRREHEKHTIFLRGLPINLKRDDLTEILAHGIKGDLDLNLRRVKIGDINPNRNLQRFAWAVYADEKSATHALFMVRGIRVKPRRRPKNNDKDAKDDNVNKRDEDLQHQQAEKPRRDPTAEYTIDCMINLERKKKYNHGRVLPDIFGTAARMKIDVEQSVKVMKFLDLERGIDPESNPFTDEFIKSLPSDAKRLDHIVTYLREAHYYCYYSGNEFLEDATSMPPQELRPVLTSEKKPSDNDKRMAKRVDERTQLTLKRDYDRPRSNSDHAVIAIEKAVKNWLDNNTINEGEGRYRCNLPPNKLFKAPEFVHKHLKSKHADKMNEVIKKSWMNTYRANFENDPSKDEVISIYNDGVANSERNANMNNNNNNGMGMGNGGNIGRGGGGGLRGNMGSSRDGGGGFSGGGMNSGATNDGMVGGAHGNMNPMGGPGVRPQLPVGMFNPTAYMGLGMQPMPMMMMPQAPGFQYPNSMPFGRGMTPGMGPGGGGMGNRPGNGMSMGGGSERGGAGGGLRGDGGMGGDGGLRGGGGMHGSFRGNNAGSSGSGRRNNNNNNGGLRRGGRFDGQGQGQGQGESLDPRAMGPRRNYTDLDAPAKGPSFDIVRYEDI